MLSKIILWVTALSFIGYGVLCFFMPQIPTGYIGFGLTNADAHIEMVAMYGGLQIGIGLFCLLGALKPDFANGSLILIIMTVGGLAVGRIFSFTLTSDPVTTYTYGAICYELMTSILAVIALVKSK